MMRRSISLILLGTVLFLSSGYELYLVLFREVIRSEVFREIKQELFPAGFTHLTLPAEQMAAVEWLRAGREFRYHGRLYDVVRIRKEKKVTHIYCRADEREEGILRKLSEHQKKKKKEAAFVKKVLTDKFFPVHSLSLLPAGSERHLFPFRENLYRSRTTAPHAPPPRMTVA